MNTRALLPLLPLLSGCIVISLDDGASDDDSTSGDGDPTTAGDGDGDPTTGDGDGDPTTGDGDGDGDGDPEEWCGLDDGPAEPWFNLSQAGALLESGSDLAVECGFQGFFMIEVDPDLGGFIPAADSVNFQVTLDVEGYNDGPDGHFAASDFDIYVACCDYEYGGDCYYLTKTIQMFPPDSIADLSIIHGAPAQLNVTMNTPDGPVVQALDVQMWAMEQDMDWQFCSYGYQVESLPLAPMPIPG